MVDATVGGFISAVNLPRIAHYPGALEMVPQWLGEVIGKVGGSGADVALISGVKTLSNLPQAGSLLEELAAQGWRIHRVYVTGEPDPEFIDEQLANLSSGPDVVDPRLEAIIAIGGGSVLDCAKSMAAMACERGATRSFLEGVGERAPSGRRLPWIAVPTTMGTGSEATHNAVLGRPALHGGFKKSLRHPAYAADRVILDARLSLALPRSVVASAGMDAYSQLLESYLSPASSPLLDRWLLYGLEMASAALPRLLLYHGEQDTATERHAMALAATLSGVGLTCTGLGVVHGLIGPVGAVAQVPHGVACANVLAPAMQETLELARSCGTAEREFVESRMARVGEMVLGAAGNAAVQGAGEKLRGVGNTSVGKISNEEKARGEGKASDKEKADALISALFDWRSRARGQGGISSLSSYGFTSEHADAVLEQASNRKNPVGLDREQWREILLAASG